MHLIEYNKAALSSLLGWENGRYLVGRKFNTLRSLHIQRSIDILFRFLQFLFRDVNANTKNKLQIKLEITSI